jgi:4-hydroxybenzoate polyprenyltransferase
MLPSMLLFGAPPEADNDEASAIPERRVTAGVPAVIAVNYQPETTGYLARALATVRRAGGAVRWSEWYASKVPFVWTSCATAALVSPLTDSAILLKTAAVILFTCLCGTFGYLANDYADRECDRLAGKPSRSSEWTGKTVRRVMVGLGMGSLVALALAATTPAAAAAGLATVALAALYSLSPVRLKERGAVGVWSGAAAQRTLPVLVAFAALGELGGVAWALAGAAQLAGMRSMVVHQVADSANDRRSGISTYVTAAGDWRAGRLLRRIIFPLEVAAVLLALCTISLATPWVWWVAATGMLCSAAWVALCRGIQKPYSLQGWDRQPLAGLYEFVWPVGTAILVVAFRPGLWPLGAAVLLWQHKVTGHRVANGLRLLRRPIREAPAPA